MKSWLVGALMLAAGALPLFPAQATPKVEDNIAQRVLACTGCHGPQGRAAPDGYYPRIAGKPAAYLYRQLLNFREGRRQYLPMQRLLDPLSDAYLREIAEHFATLDLPYPPAVPASVSPERLVRGEALAKRGDTSRKLPPCSGCHGQTLTGVYPSVPGLLGLSRDYLNSQLGAWKTGGRRAHAPDCMAQVAQSLSADEVSDVSSWLASQALPANPMPAQGPAGPLPLDCGAEMKAMR